MLRLIIRQVADTRQRAAKSLAVADLEPLLAFPVVENRQSKIQTPQPHLARLYLCTGAGQKLTVNATFTPSVTPTRDLWQYIADALQAALAERAKAPLPRS